jgi:hypothetical protein
LRGRVRQGVLRVDISSTKLEIKSSKSTSTLWAQRGSTTMQEGDVYRALARSKALVLQLGNPDDDTTDGEDRVMV